MDYEKLYKDALERAREYKKHGYMMINVALDNIFPELKESEDDRIKKALVRFHKSTIDIDGIKGGEIIAWLEKQGKCKTDCHSNHQDVNYPNGCIVLEDFNGGEGFYKLNLDYLNKKQVEEVEEMVRTWNKESKTSNENIKSCIGMCLTDANEQRFKDYNTTLKDCLAWLEKQGERSGTFTWHNMNEKPDEMKEILCEWESDDAVWHDVAFYDDKTNKFRNNKMPIDNVIKWVYVDELLENQGEQSKTLQTDDVKIENHSAPLRTGAIGFDGNPMESKPCEQKPAWSEEDEEHVNSLLKRLEGLCRKEFATTRFAINEDEDWLKSLKDRVQPQPKQEWNEEDESYLNTTIAYLKDAKEFKKTAENCINWLKSLRPQNTWKPSEEQMEALLSEVEGWTKGCPKQKGLESLYNDLKKLKEE